MHKINDYLMVVEAAEYLGVVPNTLRNWEKKGKIVSYRNPFNNYRLYKKQDLNKLLNDIKKTYGKEKEL